MVNRLKLLNVRGNRRWRKRERRVRVFRRENQDIVWSRSHIHCDIAWLTWYVVFSNCIGCRWMLWGHSGCSGLSGSLFWST